MHIEDGLVYCFKFRKTDRLKAAKIAYHLEKSENQKSLLRTISSAAKAFLTRTVTVESDTLNNPGLKHISERLTGNINSRTITGVTTTSGVDPIRKRGEAKNYTRQIVVRTWPYNSLKHPGHASLSIKGSTHQKPVYLSWWPDDKTIQSKFNKLMEKISMRGFSMDIFMVSKASLQNSYIKDKRDALSIKTEARLIAGARNYNHLKENTKLYSKDIVQDAEQNPFSPRPRQKELKNAKRWGMSADKVYIPMVGATTRQDDKKPVFSLFGLNEFKMAKFARKFKKKVKKNEAHYWLINPKENCSGAVLRTLRAGGANHFIKTNDALLVTDPNLLHKISIRLQNNIDALNKKAEFISKQWSDINPEVTPNMLVPEKTEPGNQLKSTIDQLSKTINASKTPRNIRDQIVKVRSCLKSFNNSRCSLDDLTPKTIKLVETLYKACKNFKDNKHNPLMLQPALEAFEVIKSLITEACSEESFRKRTKELPLIKF